MIPCPNCNNAFDPVGKWGIKKFCSRSCANRRTHSDETKSKISATAKGKVIPDAVRHQRSVNMAARWKGGWRPNRKHVTCSVETRAKLRKARLGKRMSESTKRLMSSIAKSRGLGGHTSKRKIWYEREDGSVIFMQSSYEVKLAMLLDSLHISWERPAPFAWADNEGGNHRYYPDFKVGDVYIDTKNDYLIRKDADKIRAVEEQNGVKIHVLSLDMITEEYIASVV